MKRGPIQPSAEATRGRAANVFSCGLKASSKPIWPTARKASSTVGGLMFDTGAPGMPIMLAGYGPKATISAVMPKPVADIVSAAAQRSELAVGVLEAELVHGDPDEDGVGEADQAEVVEAGDVDEYPRGGHHERDFQA